MCRDCQKIFANKGRSGRKNRGGRKAEPRWRVCRHQDPQAIYVMPADYKR